MNISLMSGLYQAEIARGELDCDVFLETLLEGGITGVEVMAASAAGEAWIAYRDKCIEHGLCFPCVDAQVNLIGDGTPEAEAAALEKAEKSFQLAEKLSCPTVMLFSTAPAPGMELPAARIRYGQGLAKAAGIARKYGIQICFEDFGMTPAFTARAADCRTVLDVAGKGVKFTFDNGNFVYGDGVPVEAFPLFREDIWHVHIKDVEEYHPDVRPALVTPSGRCLRECLPGAGEGQIRECLGLLKASGYNGWISCEVWKKEPEAAIAFSRYIRASWGE